MAINVTGLSIIGKAYMDPASVTAAQRALVEGMTKAAVESGQEFDKFLGYLQRAVVNADPGVQLFKSFERSMKQLSSGSVTDHLFNNLRKQFAQFDAIGEQHLASVAKIGMGLAKGGINTYPGSPLERSFDPRAAMEIDKLHADYINKNGKHSREIVDNLTAANRLLTDLHRNTITDDASKKIGRIWKSVLTDPTNPDNVYGPARPSPEDLRLARVAGGANSKLGNIWKSVLNDPQNPDNVYGPAKPDLSVLKEAKDAEMMRRKEASLADHNFQRSLRRDHTELKDDKALLRPFTMRERSIIDNSPYMYHRLQRNRTKESGQRHFMAGHNLRFATQNLGFGVDDAIQSYHYGGIGASIRAASNNITAIAGMTIPNPAVAAGTVVALSIATAILPSVLKRFGVDEETVKNHELAARVGLTRTGGTSGSLRRSSSTMESFTSKLDEYYKLTDAADARNSTYDKNRQYLAALGFKGSHSEMATSQDLHDLNYARDTAIHNAGGGVASARAAERFDAVVASLRTADKEQPLKQAEIDESHAHMEFFQKKLPAVFRHQERQHVANAAHDIALHQADSLQEYNQALLMKKKADIALVDKNPELKDHEKVRERGRIEIQYEHEKSKEYEHREKIEHTSLERRRHVEDTVRHAQDGESKFAALRIERDRQFTDITLNKELTAAERATMFAGITTGYAEKTGNLKTDVANFVIDQTRSNLGLNNPLVTLDLERQRSIDSYSRNKDLSPAQVRNLTATANAGFNDKRALLMKDMINENKITNPLGAIQDEFIRRTDTLQKMIKDGGMDPKEVAFLTTNLKQNYAKQIREANTPSGHEQFAAQAMGVGSAQDIEMRSRMTGNYHGPEKDEAYKAKTLEQFAEMITNLSGLNTKLEVVKMGF